MKLALAGVVAILISLGAVQGAVASPVVPIEKPGVGALYAAQANRLPVRFDLGAAVGVAHAPDSTRGLRVPRNASSQYVAVRADGSATPLMSQGSLSIAHYAVVGDSLYLDLGYAQTYDDSMPPCVLLQVQQMSSIPTCVDSSLSQVNWPSSTQANPAIQSSASGALYYLGTLQSGRTVLRKYFGGQTSDLITEESTISDFLVLPDGSVIHTGRSTTGATWTRLLTASGALRTLMGASALWMTRFLDGNIYMGVWQKQELGVKRFLTEAQSMEQKYWISGNSNNIVRDAYFNVESEQDGGLCNNAAWKDLEAFCGWYGSQITGHFSLNGMTLALAGSSGDSLLFQYWPNVTPIKTGISRVTLGAATDALIAVAGTDRDGVNNISIVNPVSQQQQLLLSSATEMEVYSLQQTANREAMYFAGLRFSDNTYVFGEIQMVVSGSSRRSRPVIKVLSDTGSRWSAFQTFTDAPPEPTIPGVPTGVSGRPGNGRVTVSWSAPTQVGNAAITKYVVASTPGGRTCTWTYGPLACTVTGLTNGNAYSFTVTANNSRGASPASIPSAPVRPAEVVPPGPVRDLRATPAKGSLRVTWRAPTGSVGIISYRWKVGSGAWKKTSAKEVSVPGKSGQALVVSVQAVNPAGASPVVSVTGTPR